MKQFRLFALLLLVFLLFFRPDAALSGARAALILSGSTVIPSLFPFFFLSGLFLETDAAQKAGKLFSPLMRPLFGVNGNGAIPLLLGLLGGYPLGARTAASLYRKGALSDKEYTRLVGFCNNAGPLFIVGTVGAGMLGNVKAGYLLLAAHLSAALTGGLFFRFYSPRPARLSRAAPVPESTPPSPLSHVMSAALWNSFTVAGYIVLFGAFLSILSSVGFFLVLSRLFPKVPTALFYGFFEMTGGLSQLPSALPIRTLLPFAGFLVGWGGLSVHLQAASLMSSDAFFPASYWWGKGLSAALTAIYAALFARLLPDSIQTLARGVYPEIISPKRLTLYLVIYLVLASLLFRYFATRKK